MGALQKNIHDEVPWREFKSGGLTRLTSQKGAAIFPVTWGKGEGKVSRDFHVGIDMPTNLEEPPISWMRLQGMKSEEIPTREFLLQDKDRNTVALVREPQQTKKESGKKGKKEVKKAAKKAGKATPATHNSSSLEEADDQPTSSFVEEELRSVLHEVEDLTLGLAQLVVVQRASGFELAQCLQDSQDQLLGRLNNLLGKQEDTTKASAKSVAKKKASKKDGAKKALKT